MASANSLWPHQNEAVAAITDALTSSGRATVVMACGTGKTRAAAEATARLAPEGRVLVVVPTLELLYQTVGEYRRHLGPDAGRTMAVCSQQGVDHTTIGAEELEELEEAGVLVSTDPAVLHADVKPEGRCTVLVTYASLPVIAALHAEYGLPAWDAMIIDEAHRSAGAEGRPWSALHSDAMIPAERRLYMTATPRVYEGSADEVISMDDEDVYGPQVYELGFPEAIEAGLLADYRLLVAVVTESEVAELTEAAGTVSLDGHPVPARMLAAQIALGRAIDEYGLRRSITYHSTVAASRRFTDSLPNAMDLLGRHAGGRPVFGYHVDGQMRLDQRRHVLGYLNDPEQRSVVVSNCRVLSEGVDVPELDAVMFADPRQSGTDVVQAVGRALRRGARSEGKTATIIVPVLVGQEESIEAAMEESRWSMVWRIVRALRAHDERIADELDHSRSQIAVLGEYTGELAPNWVVVSGKRIGRDFAEAVQLRLVESAASPWWDAYAVAREYFAQHGHLRGGEDVVLSDRRRSGMGRTTLAEWLAFQRRQHKAGAMDHQRVELLEQIGMVWEPRKENWQQGLASAREYARENGHLNPPRDHPVAKWLVHQRYLNRRGELPDDRQNALEELGIDWEPNRSQRAKTIEALRGFAAEHGHLRLPDGHPLLPSVRGLRRDYRAGRLDAEVIAELDSIGMVWDPRESDWHGKAQQIRSYQESHGQPSRLADYGAVLAKWVVHQRRKASEGALEEGKQAVLRELGLLEQLPKKRPAKTGDEEVVEAARRWHEEMGRLSEIPSSYRDPVSGVRLGRELVLIRQRYRKGTLPEQVRHALEEMGMVWDPEEQRWQQGLEELDRYIAEGGSPQQLGQHYVSESGHRLGSWLYYQRSRLREGQLAPERAAALKQRGVEK